MFRLDHFKVDRLEGNTGYTWSLASRLGHLLAEAEERYGERDRSWTILGVEFGPGNPQIWFPGDRKFIVVQLAMNAADSDFLARYQLAHECIHLLAPVVRADATVLEEGLAVVFSEDCTKAGFGVSPPTTLASYARAAASVRALLGIDAEAIKKLRTIESSFDQIGICTFAEAGISLPEALVLELVSRFKRE